MWEKQNRGIEYRRLVSFCSQFVSTCWFLKDNKSVLWNIISEEKCSRSATDSFREKLDLSVFSQRFTWWTAAKDAMFLWSVRCEQSVSEEQVIEFNEFEIAAVNDWREDWWRDTRRKIRVCDTKSRLISRSPPLLEILFRATNRSVVAPSQSFNVNHFNGMVERKQ